MAALTVIPLVGTLGILFIGFNVMIIILLILTIVFGAIRLVKKKFTKTFIILLILTIILAFIDYKFINNFVNYDKIQKQEQIKEEGEELIAIKDYNYNKVEQYLNNGWNPNETTKAIYYAIKYNPDENKEKDEWSILELLLKNGANPDVQIYEKPQGVNTPLTYTTECGYYGATKLLLENGADPNYQESNMNKNGLLALRFYNNDKAAETLQLLLDYGTDLDIRTDVGYGVDESGREKLKNFKDDYSKVKENVPDYDDIVKIISNLKMTKISINKPFIF